MKELPVRVKRRVVEALPDKSSVRTYIMFSDFMTRCTTIRCCRVDSWLHDLQDTWYIFFFFFTHLLSSFWTSSVSFPPRFLPSIFIEHRVQQSHCSLIFHRVLLLMTHALALSASQFVHKKKSPRNYANMRSGVFELTKPTCTRLEDDLIRHRGATGVHA